MGWSTGSSLFSDIIEILKAEIDDEDIREEIYVRMIEVFQDHDCDNLEECLGEDTVFDNVFNNQYPDDIVSGEDSWDDQDNTQF